MSTLPAAARGGKLFPLPDGTKVSLRPPDMDDIAFAELEALAHFKRTILETWSKNLDLLKSKSAAEKDALLLQKIADLERIDTCDMPRKMTWVPKLVGGRLQVNAETGRPVLVQTEVGYVEWWMQGTANGQLLMVWRSAKKDKPELSINDVAKMFGEASQDVLAEAAKDVAALTLGNSNAAPENEGAEMKKAPEAAGASSA